MTSALHRAVWRNDLEAVSGAVEQDSFCLSLGDAESGWTPLHVALYYGHLNAAATLLRKGARLDATDHADRTPLELLTEQNGERSARTEVLSWGSGANFQLGTGNSGLQSTPKRLERLADVTVALLRASKFHSMALTSEGRVYSWGWGLGGRLGHPEAKLHSENGAQIFPRPIALLSPKRIVSIAAAKHHSLAVTSEGDVYSWGLNRDGRLGYSTAASKQVTPRPVTALKGCHVLHAAAANKHSAVATASGGIYTWGSNTHGQLGYGTSDSGFNPTPRCVEALKHRPVVGLSLSKHHSLAVTSNGDVFSWGCKRVAPRQVLLQTGQKGGPVLFHDGGKLRRRAARTVAAGVLRSYCVTAVGGLLVWRSDQPERGVQEVAGQLKILSISTGKAMAALTTENGRLYCWDETQSSLEPVWIKSTQKAAAVAVGEKHALVLQTWAPATAVTSPDDALGRGTKDEVETGNAFSCLDQSQAQREAMAPHSLEPLQLMCEKAVAEHQLDPHSALQLFEYADVVRAPLLRGCCLRLILQNLALVLQQSTELWTRLSAELIQEIEHAYHKEVLLLPDSALSGEERQERSVTTLRSSHCSLLQAVASSPSSPERRPTVELGRGRNRFLSEERVTAKLRERTQKKLQQIQVLLKRQEEGAVLDEGQRAKVARRALFQKALDALDGGASYNAVQEILNTVVQELVKKDPNNQAVPVQKCEKIARPSPNLRPVRSLPPKSREVGPMPRFLEPSWRQGNRKPVVAERALPERKKTWVKLDLESEPKAEGAVFSRAQPSRETRKMSLSDFMSSPDPPPVKETGVTGPAWGGLQFHPQASFQSIQAEQRSYRPGLQRPGTRPAVERRRTVSRWQTYTDVQVQSIAAIQIEEKAVQELRQLYRGAIVRVKTGTARDGQSANR